MKTSLQLKIATLATVAIATIGALTPAIAATFGQQEVQQSKFIAIAVPRGLTPQLIVLEQISNSQPCWRESGNRPTRVEPLLLNFNFTGICGRSTDSNGYSIRIGGEDLSRRYRLRLVQRNGEMVLQGSAIAERNAPPIEIGRTYGISSGFAKIILNPGWRFTKRTYNGQMLGHVYFTKDRASLPNFRPSSGSTR